MISNFHLNLIQFFYCKRSDCPMRNKLPPDQVSLARLVDITLPLKAVIRSEGPTDLFTVLQITDWKKQVDFPDLQEIEEFGIELNKGEYNLLANWGPMETGDKLAG